MVNRCGPIIQQETLTPPWLLSSFDTNWNAPSTALNDASFGYANYVGSDTGTANMYAVTLPVGSPSTYRSGMCVSFVPANTNTGGSTLTVAPLGAATIVNPAGIALQGGEIAANRKLDLIHDGGSFRIIGVCPLSLTQAGLSGSVVVECAGFTAVSYYGGWTSGGNMALTLNHLAQGVPVNVTVVNGQASPFIFSMSANTPAGVPYATVNACLPAANGSGFLNLVTGVTLNAGSGFIISGSAPASSILNLSL
jgi:hypothetical protein